MKSITVIAYVLFMIKFITSIVISLRFQLGSEGKDERGQKIINTAYSVAFPIIPIGWLLITLYDDFIQSVGYSAYKWLIWVLIILAFIVHGVTIFILKRKW